MTEDTTTIRIKFSTKERLDKLGDKGDTYDDILNRLIEKAEKEKQT